MAVDVATLGIKIESQDADLAKRRLNEFADAGRKAEKATDGLKSSMGGMRALLGGIAAGFASLGVAALAREVVQLADRWTQLNSQLRLVSTSTDQAARTMEQLLGIAQRSRVGLGATVELYAKLARSTQDLGVTQADVRQVTENISKALTISGASAASASGALAQLGQAFASGALRGDELNSVLEGTPRIAQAIADGMGITIGQLRALGAEGKLTSEAIFNALISQTDAIESEFGQMATTVEQAVTGLSNTILVFIGYLNETSGITPTLAGLIADLAEQIDNVRIAMESADAAYNNAIGDTKDLSASTLSLGEVIRTVAETMIVLGANVGFVFSAIAKDIASVGVQAKALLSGDLRGMQDEALRRTIEAAADRKAIDAFSASVLSRERAIRSNMTTEKEAATTTRRFAAATGDGAKASRELEKAQREAERAATQFANALERVRGALASEWSAASKEATDQMRVLNEAFDKGLVTADELSEANLKLAGNYQLVGEVAPEVTGEIKTMSDAMRDSGIAVEDLQGNVEFAANQMSDAFYSVANAIDSVLYSLKSGDWGGALSGLLKTVSTIKASISEIGVLGTAGNVAGIVGSAVGGSTGSAISSVGGGLSIAALGSAASGALANATIGAAFSGAIGGTLANAGLALAGVLGPIGIIAGVAYSLSGLLKGKPTNAGAGYDLTTGQLSGNKRTAETEEAVLAAADAIKQGQDLLTSAGVNLTDSVRGLVIGTRDESQIYLSSGKTLTSAVGDAAAATETALLALLDSATYADEQQKILVESMRAAGKGFDDITAALETYASAQGLSKTFADAILAFTDPEGYAKSQLEAEQKTRRDQVQALYDELYLTAEQFASLNAQLDTLDGLELADTLSQFSTSLDDLISGAQSDLQSAYEAEAAVLNETISTYTQLLGTLRDFDDSLKGQMAANASPLAAYRQSQGAFRSIASSTDPSVLAGIPEAGQAYLQAALAIAPDKTTYARVLAEVRAGVADAEKYATDQIDTAEASLEQLKTMVGTLISIDKGVMTVAMAISNLGTLLAQQAVNDNAATTLPSWFSATQYLADNPDLARNYASGGILSQYGSLEEAAIAHYLGAGQYEIAAGNRKYATGGSFTVGGGGYSGDRVPVNFMANTGEHVNVSRQDSVGRLAAAQERQNALLAEQTAEMRKTREATERTERLWRRVSEGGTSIKTTAAA